MCKSILRTPQHIGETRRKLKISRLTGLPERKFTSRLHLVNTVSSGSVAHIARMTQDVQL